MTKTKASNETFSAKEQLALCVPDASFAHISDPICALYIESSRNSECQASEVQNSEVSCKGNVPRYEFHVAFYKEKIKKLNTSEIRSLIKNVLKPLIYYSFPRLSDKDRRSFKYEWLDDDDWLCYSPSEDGAYCLDSVLFGERTSI